MMKKSSFYVIINSMRIKVPAELVSLAEKLNTPLYVVGGYVRNYLISQMTSEDIDLASPMDTDEMLKILEEEGFFVHSV